VPKPEHQLGLPRAGKYKLLLNTDSGRYTGLTGKESAKIVKAQAEPLHGQQYSATISLPGMATLWFEVPRDNKGS
jgi:1,4-alpha-glucan branching enzyme